MLFIHIIWFEPRNETHASVAELALPLHKRQYLITAQAGVRKPEALPPTAKAVCFLFVNPHKMVRARKIRLRISSVLGAISCFGYRSINAPSWVRIPVRTSRTSSLTLRLKSQFFYKNRQTSLLLTDFCIFPIPVRTSRMSNADRLLFLVSIPRNYAFSFDTKSAKEKAWQKENAVTGISLVRERPRLCLWNPQAF